MNKIDFSHLGGMPVTQDRLDFLQQSYTAGFTAIAKLCGDKTILQGVENSGGTVSDGWIVINGEILPFVGGALAANVIIVETPTSYTFADGSSHDVEFVRYATLGSLGGFPFTDLITLLSLKHVWKKDDIRQCVKNAAYEAANFDGAGYGITAEEKGWRILSKAFVNAAGAVMVNKKDGDADFGLTENFGGAKAHQLAPTETGTIKFKTKQDDYGGGVSIGSQVINVNTNDIPNDGPGNQGGYGTELTVRLNNDATAHNNLQPYFVVLTLIKL